MNFEDLRKLIAKALKIKVSKINLNSGMSVIEEWDSLGHLSIPIALNKKLGKKSNQYKNLANATTVKDLIKILEKK